MGGTRGGKEETGRHSLAAHAAAGPPLCKHRAGSSTATPARSRLTCRSARWTPAAPPRARASTAAAAGGAQGGGVSGPGGRGSGGGCTAGARPAAARPPHLTSRIFLAQYMRMKPCILPVATISSWAAFHSLSCVLPRSNSSLHGAQMAEMGASGGRGDGAGLGPGGAAGSSWASTRSHSPPRRHSAHALPVQQAGGRRRGKARRRTGCTGARACRCGGR